MDITIFSTCKPFDGNIAVTQYNAIKSWKALNTEVILLDNESGTVQAAEKLGCISIPDLNRNSDGIPMMKSIFRGAKEATSSAILCYVNADIILLDSFLEAIEAVSARFNEFLVVSHRCNVKIDRALTFPDDVPFLRQAVKDRGSMDVPCAIDVFCYTRNMYPDIPPFVHARRAWDNWLIWDVLRRKLPVVDITSATRVIHQVHGQYVPQADPGPARTHNRSLLQSLANIPIEQPIGFISHSNYRMLKDRSIRER